MTPTMRAVLRALVVGGGIAVGVASLLTFRRADWPIYAAYVLLTVVLYPPFVEVVPGLALPIPGLAVTIGFVYIAGLPVIALQSVGFALSGLLRGGPLALWWRRVGGALGLAVGSRRDGPTAGTVADWATFALGLGVRWAIVTSLVRHGRPTSDIAAIALAELVGELAWALLSVLPIYSFRSPLAFARERGVRPLMQDLALVILFALTPFVFLIVYGYERHGLAGAVVWSFAALGLHFLLRQLNERRVTVEAQNQRLEALNRKLEHRERLSAIGKMSSVVSHQMLQQLGVIGVYADLIRHAESDVDPAAAVTQAKANAAAIEEALAGVNRVLTDLLVFSRDLRLNLYEHRLADVIAECVEECRPAAVERGVTMRVATPAEIAVTLDKLKVKQAVVNVLRNAIEASPPGGEVVVQGGARDGWAEVRIHDAGPGIPAADREHIFTPFFTTKEHGTGLGLAIAREFAEAHGGFLDVADDGASGTTFVLRLPMVRGAGLTRVAATVTSGTA
jgi:signal transduction histidine kinase